MSFCRATGFHLGGVSHLQQMSFTLFRDNDKYRRCVAGRWREDLKRSVPRVDLVWDVSLHWRCSAEREASARWGRLHTSLSPGCLPPLYPAQVYPSTDHGTFVNMVYSLIDSLLYLLYSRQELWTVKSNQTGGVDEVIRYSSSDYSL